MTTNHALVESSYRYCQQVVRRSGSNFSLAFWVLPKAQRRGMYALYAFAREVDDLADSVKPLAERRAEIERFEADFEAALDGKSPGPLMPAVADTIRRFSVPPEHFREIAAGVRMDLNHEGFETFAGLEHYCHHVASAVGLACLPIWQVSAAEARQPAIDCGLAFQLTNILRDVHEDAQLGRLYLPREDLRRFGCDAEDLFDRAHLARICQLLQFEAERAERYYQSAAALRRMLSGPPRMVFDLMYGRYYRLLQLIRNDLKLVLERKLRLGFVDKVRVAGRAVLGVPLMPPQPAP